MANANSIAADDVVLLRLEKLISDKSNFAWKLHNVLAFMVEALDDDKPGTLPVRCTLSDLQCDMDELATSLQDIVATARHMQESSHE
ncbi:hypothetical protein WL26_14690 [Burkholderia cepacia]|uniref:hypothetical protein n=1 Tax=Burkholderia cepacia TaxID=292 RepID=UPI000751E144|nr:hypothetical protein [Burkholderia cepacia]KWA12650.1 hypothetical protein WL26_14690 [Burkholderia cepacia]